MKRFLHRSTLMPVLIAAAALLTLVLLGPTLLARAQVNLFSAELARQWTPDTLIPTDAACPPAENDSVQEMQARLARADGADAHAALHQGQLACLDGDVERAGEIWLTGQNGAYVTDPVQFLDAAIARFTNNEVLETTDAKSIGGYAARQSRTSEKNDLDTAIGWQEMAFAYVPTTKTGDRLVALYKKAGQKEKAEQVWGRLTAAYPEDNQMHWLGRGRAMEQQKDWTGAMAAYLKAAQLAKTPTDQFGDYLGAGAMGRRAKMFEEAEAAYRQAIQTMPDKIKGYLEMGGTFREQKAYDEARTWYEKAGELFPDDHRPPYYLGLLSLSQKRYEDAVSHFDRSLALKPNNPSVLYNKAAALDRMQRRGEAIEVLTQAIDHHSNPPESWQKLLARWQRYPDYAQDPRRWWELGQAAEKEKNWAQAADIYHEGAGKAQAPDDYRLLEREALMHRYLKEWDAAAAIYEDLVQRYPEKINAYLGRGEVARAQMQYEEAAQWFARAQELFPEDYQPPYYLGLVAQAQKDYEKALAYFDQSLSLRPENANVLYYKAAVLDALGRREEAIRVMDQAIQIAQNPPQNWSDILEYWRQYPTSEVDPKHWAELGEKAARGKDWKQALAFYQKAASLSTDANAFPYWLRVGEMRLHSKDYEGAETAYRKALSLNDQVIEPYLGVGDSFRLRGELDKANSWYNKALAIATDDYRPYYYLGIIALTAKRYEEALSFFDQSLSIKPDNVYAMYYKAVTLKHMGREDEAIDTLARAVELHPDHPESWQNLLSQWSKQE
jgi:tetratricopeptide (TPR) repeat protein